MLALAFSSSVDARKASVRRGVPSLVRPPVVWSLIHSVILVGCCGWPCLVVRLNLSPCPLGPAEGDVSLGLCATIFGCGCAHPSLSLGSSGLQGCCATHLGPGLCSARPPGTSVYRGRLGLCNLVNLAAWCLWLALSPIRATMLHVCAALDPDRASARPPGTSVTRG